MTRNLLILFFATLAFSAEAATITQELTVHFEKDRSELTVEAVQVLDRFLSSIEMDRDHEFIIHGHTDSDGSLSYNERLSQARVQSVQQALIERGLDPKLISLNYSGERRPAADNSIEEGKAINRRVTITYLYHHFNDLSELQEELLPKQVQRFLIDPTKDEIIFGKDGCVLKFGANILVDAQGRPVTDTVEVQLTEALDLTSMITHGLSTRSGDRMIETAGMLKVDVFQGRDELKLKNGSSVEIAVPTMEPQEDMELFYSEDGSDWSAAGSPLPVVQIDSVFRYELSFLMPIRPASTIRLDLPRYRASQKGKPLRPTLQRRPHEPIAPRPESYRVNIPWWKFWSGGSLQAQADRRFENAMRTYENKKEEYERAMASYLTDTVGYAQRLQCYESDMATWEIRQKERYKEWYATERAEAIKEYAERFGAERPELERARAEWDSIYAARSQEYWQEYNEQWNAWRERQNKLLEEKVLKADATNTASISTLQAYVLAIENLGWINCDRFLTYPPAQMHEIIVKNEGPQDKQVMVVFHDVNGMMMMQMDRTNNYRSPKVPKSERATLFAYAVIDGRAHICEEPIKENEQPKLRFLPSSMAEVRDRLNNLRAPNS